MTHENTTVAGGQRHGVWKNDRPRRRQVHWLHPHTLSPSDENLMCCRRNPREVLQCQRTGPRGKSARDPPVERTARVSRPGWLWLEDVREEWRRRAEASDQTDSIGAEEPLPLSVASRWNGIRCIRTDPQFLPSRFRSTSPTANPIGHETETAEKPGPPSTFLPHAGPSHPRTVPHAHSRSSSRR